MKYAKAPADTIQPLRDFLETALSQSRGFYGGTLRIEEQITANREAICRLLELLNSKGVLSDTEMLTVVGFGQWEAEKVEFTEEE